MAGGVAPPGVDRAGHPLTRRTGLESGRNGPVDQLQPEIGRRRPEVESDRGSTESALILAELGPNSADSGRKLADVCRSRSNSGRDRHRLGQTWSIPDRFPQACPKSTQTGSVLGRFRPKCWPPDSARLRQHFGDVGRTWEFVGKVLARIPREYMHGPCPATNTGQRGVDAVLSWIGLPTYNVQARSPHKEPDPCAPNRVLNRIAMSCSPPAWRDKCAARYATSSPPPPPRARSCNFGDVLLLWLLLTSCTCAICA